MKRFRIIVAGCGDMAHEWVKYALSREEAEIVALVNTTLEKAQKMAEAYGLDCGIYRDVKDAITENNANLLFDITTPSSHKYVVTTALNAGLDVFGEKPMATSIEESNAMIMAAKSNNKTYAVLQNRRYLKHMRAFKDIVASGAIGEVGLISSDFFLGPHFTGFRDIMENLLLMEMAVHTFDQARFLTGCDPLSVYCHEFNPVGSWWKGNACALCTFEMTNGVVYSYRGSFCTEGLNTPWESEWRITGTKGTAVWNGVDKPYYEHIKSKDKVYTYDYYNQFDRYEASYEWTGREGHFGCLDDMFAALLEGRKPPTDCTDNIKSMGMAYCAHESAIKGMKIAINL